MSSNFDFLTENWNFLLKDAQRVESFAAGDHTFVNTLELRAMS